MSFDVLMSRLLGGQFKEGDVIIAHDLDNAFIYVCKSDIGWSLKMISEHHPYEYYTPYLGSSLINSNFTLRERLS